MNDDRHKLYVRHSLFELFDGADIYCVLCELETSTSTLTKHITSPVHISHLTWFRSVYNISGNNVKCNICNKVTAWDMIKIHALSHIKIASLVPAGNTGKYQILFENRVIEHKGSYHCCVCDASFSTSDFIRSHIDDPKHKSRKDPFGVNFLSRFPASFRRLVSEGLFMPDNENLVCKICHGQSVVMFAINRHIESSEHAKNKATFQLDFGECRADTINLESSDDSVEVEILKTNDWAGPEISGELDYMLVKPNFKFYCVICEYELADCVRSVHEMKPSHLKARKQHGCDGIKRERGGDYYCEYCECLITCADNVYQHIKGKKHLHTIFRRVDEKRVSLSVKTNRAKVPDSKESENWNPNNNEHLPCLYLVKLSETDVLCKCCDCVLSLAPENLVKHVSGKSHKKCLKKFGRDRITRKGSDNYYCQSCDVDIPDSETVFWHVKQEQHKQFVTLAEMQESGIKKIPGNEQRDEKPLNTYGWDNITLVGDRYHCSCCKCTIFGPDNVNFHVRGKVHIRHALSVATRLQAMQIEKEFETEEFGDPPVYKRPVAPLQTNAEPPLKIRTQRRPITVAEQLQASREETTAKREPAPVSNAPQNSSTTDEMSRLLNHCALYGT